LERKEEVLVDVRCGREEGQCQSRKMERKERRVKNKSELDGMFVDARCGREEEHNMR
jgi:hypothetical protein